MKINEIKNIMLLSAAAVSLFFAGCGNKTYGSGIDDDLSVPTVAELFNNDEYMGQRVTVEGRVYVQCPSNGCWFVLQDDTGQIYVDLSENGFEMPPMRGRGVAVTGVVSSSRGSVIITAEGVEVR